MIDSQRTAAILTLIEEDIVDVMATANAAGFSSIEIIHALEMIVKNAKIALEEDPDPADDPVN